MEEFEITCRRDDQVYVSIKYELFYETLLCTTLKKNVT